MATRYRVHDTNVAWRVADDEAVVLHADSSAYYGLNQIGTLLWVQLAEHPMTLEQLSAWAESFFPAAPPSLPAEVSAFVQGLLELNLIEGEEIADAGEPGTTLRAAEGSEPPLWEAPTVERFGELEKLILSGE